MNVASIQRANLSIFNEQSGIKRLDLPCNQFLTLADGKETERYTDRSLGQEIKFVVLHNTVCNFEDTVARLSGISLNPDKEAPALVTSVHYIIPKAADLTPTEDDQGKPTSYLVALVPEDKNAYHVGPSAFRGNYELNQSAIGIEIVNNGQEPFEEGQIETLALLCTDLLGRYHNLTAFDIVGHSDVAIVRGGTPTRLVPNRKQDPSGHFDWEKFYGKMQELMADDPRQKDFAALLDIYRNKVTDRETGSAKGEAFISSSNTSDYDKECIEHAIKTTLGKEQVETILNAASGLIRNPVVSVYKQVLDFSYGDGDCAPSPQFVIDLVRSSLAYVGFNVYQGSDFDENLEAAVECYNRHYVPSRFINEVTEIRKGIETMVCTTENKRIYPQTVGALMQHCYAIAAHEQELSGTPSGGEHTGGQGPSLL